MNPLKIAASVAVAPSLSLNTARDVVTLDNTDFTDVAAVVVSLADTRSGVLTLLRQTGFNLPVFVANAFDDAVLTLPGVTGEINGAAEEWQALEQAAQPLRGGTAAAVFRHPEPVCGDGQQHFRLSGPPARRVFQKTPGRAAVL